MICVKPEKHREIQFEMSTISLQSWIITAKACLGPCFFSLFLHLCSAGGHLNWTLSHVFLWVGPVSCFLLCYNLLLAFMPAEAYGGIIHAGVPQRAKAI
jgi:hypothetical protein